MRWILILLLLLLVLILITARLFLTPSEKNLPVNMNGTLCWREADCMTVEIMNTPRSLAKGWMNRDPMPENAGAFLVFDAPDYYSEWMKDMRFSTDFVWISSDGRIIQILEGLQPCGSEQCPVYTSPEPALYGVEVNAGYTKRHNLTDGMTVKLPTENEPEKT